MIGICGEHPLEGAVHPIGQLLDSPYMIEGLITPDTVREPLTVDDRITV